MSGRVDDEAIEAATQAAVAEAFAEYEAREQAARATTSRRAALPPSGVAVETSPEDLTPRPIVAMPADPLLSRLEAWLAAAPRADYFAILGLTPRATEGTIDRAHALACAALDALGDAGGAPADAARALLDEARAVLGDPATRATYARHVGDQKPLVIFWLPGGPHGP